MREVAVVIFARDKRGDFQPMKLTDPDRGANVRGNLVRWKKPLLWTIAGWLLLTILVLAAAVIYADKENLSPRRAQKLAASCGFIMGGVFFAGTMVVLLLADRKKR
jgi:hypothetical protein